LLKTAQLWLPPAPTRVAFGVVHVAAQTSAVGGVLFISV
jgi:hypothetical protein